MKIKNASAAPSKTKTLGNVDNVGQSLGKSPLNQRKFTIFFILSLHIEMRLV